MKDLCLKCEKRDKCVEPCKKVMDILLKSSHEWGRGTNRKLLIWDFNNIPGQENEDTKFIFDMKKVKFTERQQRIFDLILEQTPLEETLTIVGISKWVFYKEVRKVKKEISKSKIERKI